MQKVITRHFDVPDMYKLHVALQHGAYVSLAKLFKMKPFEVMETVKASGLRGRGGAGFPTGVKWGFIPRTRDPGPFDYAQGRPETRDPEKPVYLVVNADESEPGTFKDRSILERDPHLLVEGIIIAAYAIGAKMAFAYFRGEYARQWQRFVEAVDEARSKGLIGRDTKGSGFDLDIVPHRGAGAYICGEETALLTSIEGYRGTPRIRPPFPAVSGLFACPTIVNNVETLSSLPFIVREGADEYRKIGTEKSPGTKLISVSGHVPRPGVYEIELGMPVAAFLAECAGGTLNGRRLKALIPGGTSVPVLTAEEALGTRIDFESLASSGSMLGSGGMIVIDESACMVRVLLDIAKFYAHESCGQCTPCREGCGWIEKIVSRIEVGDGCEGDLDLLLEISDGMMGRTICVLADALAMPVKSFVTKFRDEFEQHIHLGRCVPLGK